MHAVLAQPMLRLCAMSNSRHLARLVGPTVVAMIVSEFPLVQPTLYEKQIPPVVYLSGVLMFVSGLAILRAHSQWRPDWTVLITLTGWLGLILGLVRMFAASAYQAASSTATPEVFMIIEGVLLIAGLVMTWHGYVARDLPHGE